jgi:hypothetical protein
MWWADGAAGIHEGLGFYDDATGPIEADYDAIEKRAKSRSPHALDIHDLTIIVQFKLWPGMRKYAGEKVMAGPSPEAITAMAFEQARAGDVHGALLALDRLPQVGIPTASAILAAVYPEQFAVIDRYAMSEVGYLATTWTRQGRPADEGLALLTESLTEWTVESWASAGAGASAYPPFIAGLQLKAELIRRTEGESFRPRDIEKAMYGHLVKRTGRRVL